MIVTMNQIEKDRVSAVVDGLLKFIAGGGFVTTALLAPNAVQIFDKPLAKFINGLDKRARERELRRIAHYMKQKGLIAYTPRDYENGIKLTKAGKERLKKRDFDQLSVPVPRKWDKQWRLVFFDIPIQEDKKRYAWTLKLRQLGFQTLQKSIWVYPFPSRPEIEAIAETLGVRKYVTYVEVSRIDGEKLLKARFKHILIKAK